MTPASTRAMGIGRKAGFTPLRLTLWIKLKGTIKHVLDINACSGNQWSRGRFVILMLPLINVVNRLFIRNLSSPLL
jgi:hypothetical protein